LPTNGAPAAGGSFLATFVAATSSHERGPHRGPGSDAFVRMARATIHPVALSTPALQQTMAEHLARLRGTYGLLELTLWRRCGTAFKPVAADLPCSRSTDTVPRTIDSAELAPYLPGASTGKPFITAGDDGLIVVPPAAPGERFALLVCRAAEPLTEEAIAELQLHAGSLDTFLALQDAAADVRDAGDVNAAVLTALSAASIVFDGEGRIVSVASGHDAGNAMWPGGDSPRQGDRFDAWCGALERAGFAEAPVLLAAVEAVRTRALRSWRQEFAHRAGGNARWFEVTLRAGNDESERTVMLWRDVTERREAETAARLNERRLRLMLDAVPAMIWLAEVSRRGVYFNRAWMNFTGRTIAEELDTGWMAAVHPDDAPQCISVYNRAFDAKESFSLEYRLRRRDGQYRWILETGLPWTNDDGVFVGFIGSAIDITERRRAEDLARELSGRLIIAQEEERRRIAREVHDDFGQRLALLAIELEQLSMSWPRRREELAERSNHIARAAAELSSDLHRLSHRLHPVKLEALGLVAAIESFCRELLTQHGFHVHFAHEGVPRGIPRQVSLCLYRIVQEALLNVIKHSGVMKADVQLLGNAGELVLRIADPGQGFDPASARADGLGLSSMRERVRSLGGDIVVHSAPGGGTRIGVRVRIGPHVGEKQTA
jgi:PAS domain S-box-containing protein